MIEGNIVESTISLKPGVFSSYGHAWRHLWKYFLDLLLGLIIVIAITVPLSFLISWFVTGYWPNLAVSYAFSFLIAGPLGYGFAYMTLRAVRNEKVEIQHLFEGFRRYGNTVLAIILTTLIVAVPSYVGQLALLNLPLVGILIFLLTLLLTVIFSYKLVFTPFLVVDRKMKATDAIKTSWYMTSGHFWKIFFISLLAIPIIFIGLLCLVVGIIPAMIWVYLAVASLYHAVDMKQPDSSTLPEEHPRPIGPDYS